MRCADVRDLIHPFLDGELEVDRNVELLKHLELCSACQARSEAERRLAGLLASAATEPLDEDLHARVLGGVRRAGARRPWAGRLALAAGALLAAGLGLLALVDPLCLFGCATQEALAHAFQAAQEQEVVAVGGCGLRAVDCPRLEVVGGNLVCTPGCAERPWVRYRCRRTGNEMTFFRVPEGHAHFWTMRELADGRRYAALSISGGASAVGWRDQEGAMCFCVSRSAPPATLHVMASAVRDAGGR